jgi:hypothetical protein
MPLAFNNSASAPTSTTVAIPPASPATADQSAPESASGTQGCHKATSGNGPSNHPSASTSSIDAPVTTTAA